MITDVDTALKDIADWFIKNRRDISPDDILPILRKHCETEAEMGKFLKFLETEPGQLRFKIHLRERKGEKLSYLKETELKHYWVEMNPEGSWAIVEAFPSGTVRSPFKTNVEAIKREHEIGAEYDWNLKQVPSPQEKFPKQHETLKKLYPYEFIEYHDDGDLTIQLLLPKPKPQVGFKKGELIVVTTDGRTFKESDKVG